MSLLANVRQDCALARRKHRAGTRSDQQMNFLIRLSLGLAIQARPHLKLSAIVQSWRRVWEQVIPFFAYPKEIRITDH